MAVIDQDSGKYSLDILNSAGRPLDVKSIMFDEEITDFDASLDVSDIFFLNSVMTFSSLLFRFSW